MAIVPGSTNYVGGRRTWEETRIKRGALRTYTAFEMRGWADMMDDLYRMDKDLRTEKGLQVLRATMGPVAGDVRNNVPIDEHDLKSSVRITSGQDRRGIKSEVRAGVPGPHSRYKKTGRKKPVYALQVEYGTDDTPEQPFMRPAFDGKEMKIADRAKALFNNMIIAWKIRNRIKP